MRALRLPLGLGLALGLAIVLPGAQAVPGIGRPIITPAPAPSVAAGPCPAQQLRATYSFVPGSNATGHVEYILTVTNRSAGAPCAFPAPLRLTLLGRGAKPLPTTTHTASGRSYEVVLGPGQWAQATSQLSPDLYGPGEPAHGNCEPTARALRVGIGHATIRAPMDPTPVCRHGAIQLDRLVAIPPTPSCPASSLRASIKRDSPPTGGFATYNLTLRNELAHPCHTNSIVGLHLLGSGGRKLATRVRAGVSSPYVFPAHALESAFARLSTEASRGGGCDPTATRLAITPIPGSGTVTTAIQPPLRVCSGGLIGLSSLFVNG
jgi:Protein of unknown function (DUF4232)